MPVKRVRVSCHEPLAVDPQARQPWADVYLRFKTRPGNHVVRSGPTLMGRNDLRRTIASTRRLATNDADGPFAEELAVAEALLARVDVDGIVVDTASEGYARGCPDVYTAAPELDRAEASRMILAVLALHGVTRCRLDWRRPDLVIVPA
jgi:hypothetical protein